MSQNVVVGIIGGQGWMGRALGLSLLTQGIVPAHQLVISSRAESDNAYQDWPDVRCVTDNHELVELADVIVLSVRPEDLTNIDIKADGKLIISLLAMASLQVIASQVGSHRVVRAMPNAAAQIRRGYLPWYAPETVNKTDRQLVQRLLESCGTAQELSKEHHIDYLTALSGSGPAYPALLAQAMLTHAQQNNMPDDIAHIAVIQTLVGGSLLLESLEADPGDMVERLIAYDGTTAKGLQAMIDGDIQQTIHRGLDAAYRAARG